MWSRMCFALADAMLSSLATWGQQVWCSTVMLGAFPEPLHSWWSHFLLSTTFHIALLSSHLYTTSMMVYYKNSRLFLILITISGHAHFWPFLEQLEVIIPSILRCVTIGTKFQFLKVVYELVNVVTFLTLRYFSSIPIYH